jgi:rRNA biogenesis protein RRP5
MVLGQVASINDHDIGLALPNNLTGYVPLTSISKNLDQKIEKMLNEEEEDEEEGSDGSEEDTLDLKAYFRLGQYLRAYVTSTGGAATDTVAAKSKKRIELSVDPRQANSGLLKSDLVENSIVQASVVSVEEYGLVMDLGIEDPDLRGFMSSKEIDPEVDYSSIKEGTVFLCVITGFNASRTVIKLSANLQTAASIKKSHYLSSAPTINSYLPGTAAEILLTDVSANGMVGKIMGLLDSTVDLVHSGANSGTVDLTKKFHNGAKIKGRIICTFPAAEPFKVGFSVLDHVLKFTSADHSSTTSDPTPTIAAIVPDAKVVKVESGLGLYVEIGSTKHLGFVHISKVSDGTVESISSEQGPFKVGSVHEARIVGYNVLDNLFLLSFERRVIDQPFIRLEDVAVGTVVKGKIEKLLIGPTGMDGIILSLADGITGLVPSMHFADAQLQHPEKKFREGTTISARILSVDLTKRQIRLTLKKSLLNSESAIWKDYDGIVPGAQSPGTIVKIQPNGAVVQFYGAIRGFLPVSEMSEAYIKDPSQHFRRGQVVNVHALSVDASLGKLVVSCKDFSAFSESYREAFDTIHPGTVVTGTVFEKSSDDVLLKLEDSGVIARLDARHLTDGSEAKQSSTLAKIRVGQKLSDLLVLDIKRAHRLIRVTNKPSLKKALKQEALPGKFEDIQEGAQVTGFIRNITAHGIFVEFLGGLTALLPKRLISDEHVNTADFGMLRSQPISATVHQFDRDFRRFTLTMKPSERTASESKERKEHAPQAEEGLVTNPVDESIKSMADFTFGRVTKAKIVSIKETQINVRLADNVQGRIDISEVFDRWEDIKDPKQPLRVFHTKQIVPVRILGIHDARGHRFLPISHRIGKYPVFEVSAKPSFINAENPNPLSLDQIRVGSLSFGFINNITDECLWVNLSPNVRGRLRTIDLTDDLSTLADIEKNFPVGSALKVRVTAVDLEKGHLDLSGKQEAASELSLDKLSKGMILPGRVTKVTEKQIIIQLSDTIVGAVNLMDMADDYSKIDPSTHRKNEVLRTCIVDIDKPNKKVYLSLRPSKVLSSSLPVRDPEISSLSQLNVNDIVRGFVRRVADNGLFVALGHNVTAYVRVSDLSDSYLKEWKDEFQVDQLVKGRIVFLDPENNKVQMSLKESVLEPNYKTPLTLRDLQPGQVVTGTVRNVEEFGAFIVVDGSANVSGLCHRSEMAEQRVEDARKLFEKGDAVKAKILKIDLEQQRISFGLKASYFEDEEDVDASEDEDSDDDQSVSEAGGVDLESDDDSDEGITLQDIGLEGGSDSEDKESDEDEHMAEAGPHDDGEGLDAGGFDWTGGLRDNDATMAGPSDSHTATKGKKKHRKPEIQIDRTGELDARGPQSVADYERLLLGDPDSSILWLQYMAFQLELGEVDKAREIAERAIRSISIGEETEKLNIWVALLNLENTYGSEEALEEVFNRACQYNDSQEIYERMISIFIQSGKNEVCFLVVRYYMSSNPLTLPLQKADDFFQTALKKKIFHSPKFYVNYATFLFDTMAAPDRGRALLPRAIQSLPSHTHVELTSKFGQLEFRSPNGDVERGRTVFEGLLSSFPKRADLWNVLLDLEIKIGDSEQVRRLFQRVLGVSSSNKSQPKKSVPVVTEESKKKLKPKQARFFFKKWLAFEEKLAAAEGGNEKMVEEVKARAAEYVKALQEE